MFGKHTLKNVKSLRDANLSMKVIREDKKDYCSIHVILYADKENEYSNIEIIGSLKVKSKLRVPKLNDKRAYCVIETAGAYIGFGSLLYQSALIEIKSVDASALFISDRECLTDDAKGMYRKMVNSDLFEKERITPGSHHFSDQLDKDEWYEGLSEDIDAGSYQEYAALVSNASIPNSAVNTAYRILPTEQMLLLHKKLKKNDVARSLTDKQYEGIIEEADIIGEWVQNSMEELKEEELKAEMFSGYPSFGIKAPELASGLEHA